MALLCGKFASLIWANEWLLTAAVYYCILATLRKRHHHLCNILTCARLQLSSVHYKSWRIWAACWRQFLLRHASCISLQGCFMSCFQTFGEQTARSSPKLWKHPQSLKFLSSRLRLKLREPRRSISGPSRSSGPRRKPSRWPRSVCWRKTVGSLTQPGRRCSTTPPRGWETQHNSENHKPYSPLAVDHCSFVHYAMRSSFSLDCSDWLFQVMEAEQSRTRSEIEHRETAAKYNAAISHMRQLEKKLKRTINKSRSEDISQCFWYTCTTAQKFWVCIYIQKGCIKLI